MDGRTGVTSWEHVVEGMAGAFSDVAIHPNGTVYATEAPYYGTSHYLIGITPGGSIQRWELPKGRFTRHDSGGFGLDVDGPSSPWSTTAPIVRDDGSVVAVTVRHFVVNYIISYMGPLGIPTARTDFSKEGTFIADAQLIVVPEGGGSVEIRDITGDAAHTHLDPRDYQLMPDGQGGLLLGDRQTGFVLRIDPLNQFTGSVVLPGFTDATLYETEYVLGDGAYAVVNGFFDGLGATHWSKAIAFDPQTLSITSESFLGDWRTEPGHLRLKFALGGGGIYVSGPTEAYAVNASVSAFGFAAGGNASHIMTGLWAGWNVGPALAVGSDAVMAMTVWPYPQGSLQQANKKVSEFTITVNTFIPEEWVDNPVEWITSYPTWNATIFEGDNRTEFAIDGSHRSQQRVTVDEYGLVGPSRTHAGWTRLYDKASSLDSSQRLTPAARADTTLGDNYLMLAVARSTDQAVATASRLPGRKLRLELRVALGDG